jgi:catechol 2,3-dioxygenase
MEAPDWKTITWSQAERNKGQAWALQSADSFRSYATPSLPEKSQS